MEDNDIKCLPDDFVGTSKPSMVIERLQQKRKNAEKNALLNMNARKKEICLEYEKLVEKKSGELNKNLDDMKSIIKNHLFQSKLKANKDNAANLEKASFYNIYSTIRNYTKRRHDLVDEFYNNLVLLEREKSNEFKSVLKRTYEEIQKISFKLPYECDEWVEIEIENMNQTILCNQRNYMELKNHLQLEIENDSKNFIEELSYVKECWIKYLKSQTEQAIETLQAQNLRVIAQADPDYSKSAADIKSEVQEIQATTSCIGSVMKLQQAEQWINSVRRTLAKLDYSSQKMISAYKQAAVLVFNRFFQELEVIAEQMNEMIEKEEIETLQCEMYTPTLEEINQLYNVELEKIQGVWNDLVDQLSKTMYNTYTFLIASATLWEKYFKRTEVLQVVILKDVDNTIIANNNQTETNETKLNILIDTLRQEPSSEKVNKTMEDIKKLLVAVEELYKFQYQVETGVYKKYKATQEFKIDLLLAEIKRFINIYPPDLEKDPKIQRKRASQTSEIADPRENLIPDQMMYCKYQIGAVSNWQFGLWEAISNYAAVAKTEILGEIEQWIKLHSGRLDKRLEVRLALHSLRIEKIFGCIYDVRLEELCMHQSRFEEHKHAVDKLINDLKERCVTCLKKYDETFQEYDQHLNQLQYKCVTLSNSGLVNAHKAILKAQTENCMEHINGLYLEYLQKLNNFFERVKTSNIKFTENMKLFSEGGNFSVQETKDYLKHQSKIEAEIDKCLTSIVKDVENGKGKIALEIEARNKEILQMLEAIRQEHVFMETLQKKLTLTKEALRKEVCNFQYDFKYLVHQFEKSTIDFIVNYGNYNYFNSFVESLKDLIPKTEKLCKYLCHSVPVLLYSNKTDVSEKVSFVSHKGEEVDYTRKLFNFTIDEDDSNFLMNLNKILVKNWNHIMTFAKDRIAGFQNIIKHPRLKIEDIIPNFEGVVEDIMKPVEPAVRKLIYTGNNKDGRINYLNKRMHLLPEDRYYFPECTSWEHGWKMWNHAKAIRKTGFGRQQVIKESFYRKRGVGRDPDWYREPAHISPTFCNTCRS